MSILKQVSIFFFFLILRQTLVLDGSGHGTVPNDSRRNQRGLDFSWFHRVQRQGGLFEWKRSTFVSH